MMRGGRTAYPGKRMLDLAFLLGLLPFTAPLAAVTALVIRIKDGSPIIFRQERVGLDGKPFHLLKFRSMCSGADRTPFPDADLMTSCGRILRRTSLDELPQLWNVARGEMSLVGPRPTLGYQVDRYNQEQRGRLAVRPGLTGLAQIRGRNGMMWADRITLDLEYVQTASLTTDLKILLASVRVVLSGSGTLGHPAQDPLAIRPEEP